MDLLFLAFGPEIKNHKQANFAILSLLNQEKDFNAIYVYTDYPQFYARLENRVNLVLLSPEKLQDWKGKYDYHIRLKLKVLEHHILANPQSPVVFLDTDTFLFGNNLGFKAVLENNQALLHEFEGPLHQQKNKSLQKLWTQVNGKTFAGITLTDKHTMWNSGVIGIPVQKNLETIKLALQLCDEILEQSVRCFFLEQYVISIALAKNYSVKPANSWIGHYWGNKDGWNEAISTFFLESHLKNYSVAQDLERIKSFDFHVIPIRKKVKNTRVRLQKMLQKLFPDKKEIFVQKK